MDQNIATQLRESFKTLLPIANELGTVYGRLFEAHPQLRPLFAEDIQSHARSLMHKLALMVDNLQKIDAILSAVSDLARRHQDNVVLDEHYLVAGDSLVWVLEQGLEHVLTSDEWEAWTTTLDTLSHAITAAKEPVGAPQRQ
ncbi:globin domain-containing protein [Bradyrhizobium iriomotense]|uniref:globin domain-containing protein n=1 Tax=Bradyrhizobium iriomotense TaxID=441950 RepID=UPI001B8A78E3|nr:globin domain-containing protein [Bradyrhizobium iriomotense]MBR0785293.1 hemin receptor [Bradyrhizobium iriomotense]